MKLWDRITGREAERLRQRIVDIEVGIAAERRRHADEITQLRLAALDAGVLLRKHATDYAEVTRVGDDRPRYRLCGWEWEAEYRPQGVCDQLREEIVQHFTP